MSSVNRLSKPNQQPAEDSALAESGLGIGATVKCYVEENPTIATAVSFGLGLAVGLVATSLLVAPAKPEYSSAQRLGRYVLDHLSHVLPESLASRISG